MTKLKWDQAGERRYETGIDHGVLYIPDANGAYTEAAAWNGLTTVTETPSGAESNPQYADNIKYLNLLSAEEFALTVEAFTYPKLFAQCDGLVEVANGVVIAQQTRKSFGLAYRSLIGTDLDSDAGYKLHLAYGCLAAPSEKAFTTVNDSPEAQGLSWEVSTTSVQVPGHKPTSLLTIDSTEVDADALAQIEDIIYGTDGVDARLPLPEEVLSILEAGGSGATERRLTSGSVTYDSSSHVVTIPNSTGVQYYANGVAKNAGALPALSSGESVTVTALPKPGNVLSGQDRWTYDY